MALALELERLGHEVVVLESGDREVDSSIAEASHAEIVDVRRHSPMEISVCRALGGTSWTWSGRSVAFDDVDFMDRDFVPQARWPFSHDSIRPWYKLASRYLLCGNGSFSSPFPRLLTNGLTLDFVERWATEPRLILVHRDALRRSEKIKISLKSTVTGLNFANDGRTVESLEVATPGGTCIVKAKQIILATGGVEATRLLLNVQRKHPRCFGGVDGPLGRYYMGHLTGNIASIQLDNPQFIAEMDFKRDTNGPYYRRHFTLTAEAQITNQVLNTAFWPDNPPFYDPSHRSGVLSWAFLVLAFPPSGHRLKSDAIRLFHTGPRPYKVAAHFRNAILGAPGGAGDMFRILFEKSVRKTGKPGFLVRNPKGKYALRYRAEQIPNPSSRIGLNGETDAFGMRRAKIDLRYTDQDIDSVFESHRILDQALRANRIGRLDYLAPPEKTRARIWEAAGDGYHQVGATRMGVDPALSVVDSNLKVHGLSNLHIASSSVFPSTGQANPTQLAVALAMRLAHRLAASLQ